jgi:hypothetical protein
VDKKQKMAKKKVVAKVKGSPSDLQGLANLMSGDSDNANTKSSDTSTRGGNGISSSSSRVKSSLSPRKLADDFQESPLKSTFVKATSEQPLPIHRMLEVKLLEKAGKVILHLISFFHESLCTTPVVK